MWCPAGGDFALWPPGGIAGALFFCDGAAWAGGGPAPFFRPGFSRTGIVSLEILRGLFSSARAWGAGPAQFL